MKILREYLDRNDWRKLLLELLAVAAVAGFIFFHGLGAIGLTGADEPRYAQIAREMFHRHDWITPTLWGDPWLEKPALYYWRAMVAYDTFGVHDWSARLPSATFAFGMVWIIYFHMRRFRPGAQLDAALITASCAAVVGFSHGASTDMQLAAPFVIGMLGWYAWFVTRRKLWLFDFYFFMAVGTLAKGPVAPALAAMIIIPFCLLRRRPWEWAKSLWLPGIALFFAIALPWYVAVQHRNPQFLHVFIFQHNLERFGTNLFQHSQPFWYYAPVMLLALMPWAFIAALAVWDALRESIRQWRVSERERAPEVIGDAFPEFLTLWVFIPVIFFTLSRSKLPGYILPAVPPCTILAADYLARLRRRSNVDVEETPTSISLVAPKPVFVRMDTGTRSVPKLIVFLHALVTGTLVGVGLLLPYVAAERQSPPALAKTIAALLAAATLLFIYFAVVRRGAALLRFATLVPILFTLWFLENPAAHVLDEAYSSRPLAAQLQQLDTAGDPVAVFHVRREVEFGLGYYRDQRIPSYDRNEIPLGEHFVVLPQSLEYEKKLIGRIGDRAAFHVGNYPAQKLEIYRIAAR